MKKRQRIIPIIGDLLILSLMMSVALILLDNCYTPTVGSKMFAGVLIFSAIAIYCKLHIFKTKEVCDEGFKDC